MKPVEPITITGIVSTDYLPKFEHFSPKTLDELFVLVKRYGPKAVILAGGTDLLRELKSRVQATQPEVLINIKGISDPGLSNVADDGAGLVLGSMVILNTIERNELIRGKYSLLAQAAHTVGGPQIRNMGTLGGNLCQHVMCWYYRASGNAYFCIRKGGRKCDAVTGDNRYHGIWGAKGCFAVCPSTLAPALIALGATATVNGTSGERTVPVEEFFAPLGNVLEPGEILTQVRVPAPSPGSRQVYKKFGLRNTFDISIVSVAIAMTVKGKVCNSASIVLGEVSPLPRRAVEAERLLKGQTITQARIEDAAQAAVEGAKPLRMNAYKLDIARALLRRAINEAAGAEA